MSCSTCCSLAHQVATISANGDVKLTDLGPYRALLRFFQFVFAFQFALCMPGCDRQDGRRGFRKSWQGAELRFHMLGWTWGPVVGLIADVCLLVVYQLSWSSKYSVGDGPACPWNPGACAHCGSAGGPFASWAMAAMSLLSSSALCTKEGSEGSDFRENLTARNSPPLNLPFVGTAAYHQ